MKKKIIKICAWGAGIIAITCLALMLVCNQNEVNNTEEKMSVGLSESTKHGTSMGKIAESNFRLGSYQDVNGQHGASMRKCMWMQICINIPNHRPASKHGAGLKFQLAGCITV